MTYPPSQPARHRQQRAAWPHHAPPPPRPRRKRWPIVLAVICGPFAIAALIGAIFHPHPAAPPIPAASSPAAQHSQAPPPSPPHWKARVQDYAVINPADLAVTVRVTNTGGTAGTPDCTVQASDPSGAYTGIDAATLSSPVKAGAFAVYVDNVTITSQGAQYVTQVSVSCS